MVLLIDTDRDKSTGWNGYDFIINHTSPKGKQVVVEKSEAREMEMETGWKRTIYC